MPSSRCTPVCFGTFLGHFHCMTSPALPVFEHDCDGCTFLGHAAGRDLWFCPQGGSPTVIARWASDGPEYESMSPFSSTLPPFLGVARDRAAARGLI